MLGNHACLFFFPPQTVAGYSTAINNKVNPASVMFFVSFSAKWKKHESGRCIRSQSNLALLQLNRRLKKIPDAWITADFKRQYKNLAPPGLFPVKEVLASIVYISSFSQFNSRCKNPARQTPDNAAQRNYKGEISPAEPCLSLWCILWAATPASILAVHKHHCLCVTEWREGGSALSYIFGKLKHDSFGECWWVNRFYSESEEWNVKIPEAAPSACRG